MNFSENEKTELKEIYTSDIKKEVIAFANASGGVIYVGVTNDGNAIGVENIDDVVSQLTNSIRDSIRPDVTIFTQSEIINVEDKNIIKLSVSEGTRKPYYLMDKGIKPSGVYIRQGNSKAPASEDAIRNMIKLSDGNSFESNRSLEQNLHFSALEKEMKLRSLEFEDVQKKTLGILSQDDVFTNLALIVSDECKHSIKLAIFQGTDKSVFKDRQEFGGSVFSQLNDIYKAISAYNNTKATFDELIRIDQRSYPTDAIREALLNAIIHRDYSYSGSIFVNIYYDRIEIISLGGLEPGLSMEAAMMGISQPRNVKLAALFYRMKLIESYGIGIGKIMDAYKESAAKPLFQSVEGAFKVTLPNMNVVSKELTEAQSKIVDYLKANTSITRKEAEKLLGVKLTRANAVIKEMLELGIIIKIGSGKDTEYILMA